jgi:hypothetical protein
MAVVAEFTHAPCGGPSLFARFLHSNVERATLESTDDPCCQSSCVRLLRGQLVADCVQSHNPQGLVKTMNIDPQLLDWLLEGDPVIRWQVMRDLLQEPEAVWRSEQDRVATYGWGAAFLHHQLPDGSWPKGRWTETVWTLLLLLDCGMPTRLACLQKAADLLISSLLRPERPVEPGVLKQRLDLCHVGFWLRIGSALLPGDERLTAMAEVVFDLQMADGGWNCRIRNYPNTTHSSFHTTFNVLDGLREAAEAGVVERARFEAAEARALEFMLAHRLYKSDKTGAVIHERMTHLTFPSYWHYTVLRGLDYMRSTRHVGDSRLEDAIELLKSRRKPNGRWPVEKRIAGITFFDMEQPGGDSRWNTLRALRVLKARSERAHLAE